MHSLFSYHVRNNKTFYTKNYTKLTPLSNVSPTIWPKKSVKLTGCPRRRFLSMESMYLMTPLSFHHTVELMLFFSSSCMSPGAILGHLVWEYRVDMYLVNLRYSLCHKRIWRTKKNDPFTMGMGFKCGGKFGRSYRVLTGWEWKVGSELQIESYLQTKELSKNAQITSLHSPRRTDRQTDGWSDRQMETYRRTHNGQSTET